jgi:hypothetical protein
MKYILNKYCILTLDFEWPRQSRQYLIFFKLDFFKTFGYVFLRFSLGPSTILKTPKPRPHVFFLQRTHLASMYQILFPKIKSKHITLCIYHPFDEIFHNFKDVQC